MGSWGLALEPLPLLHRCCVPTSPQDLLLLLVLGVLLAVCLPMQRALSCTWLGGPAAALLLQPLQEQGPWPRLAAGLGRAHDLGCCQTRNWLALVPDLAPGRCHRVGFQIQMLLEAVQVLLGLLGVGLRLLLPCACGGGRG